MLPGEPYAHIALQNFGNKADTQLRAALQEAKEQGAKGVILDLRGNPGGFKDEAVKVTSEFLDERRRLHRPGRRRQEDGRPRQVGRHGDWTFRWSC